MSDRTPIKEALFDPVPKNIAHVVRDVNSGKSKAMKVTVPDGLNLFIPPDNCSLKLSDLDDEDDGLGLDRSKLVDENERLRQLVRQRDSEIDFLRKKNQLAEKPSAGKSLTGELAVTKVIELSRKLRVLTVELEREKTKNKSLWCTIQELEHKLVETTKQTSGKELNNNNGLNKEQLTRLQQALEEHQEYEKEEQTNRKAEMDTIKMNHDEDLTRLRAIISDREEQLHHMEKEMTQVREQFGKKGSPLNPGSNSAPPVRSFTDSSTMRRISKSSDHATGWTGSNYAGARDVFHPDEASTAAGSSRFSNGAAFDDDGDGDGDDLYELDELRMMCHEYRVVAQATQVEKEKLLELLSVLNKRLEETSSQAIQSEKRVQELQLKTVQLEKQLGRANLELNNKSPSSLSSSSSKIPINSSFRKSVKRTPRGSSVEHLPSSSSSPSSVDELKTRLGSSSSPSSPMMAWQLSNPNTNT